MNYIKRSNIDRINAYKRVTASIFAISGSLLISAQGEANRPNIIMFLVDDMGWQDTSVPFWKDTTQFNRLYETPNMELLASEGMKFTQAYACPISSPTRTSLMTGMNAARHRVTNWTLRKNGSNDTYDPIIEMPKWNLNGLQPENSQKIERATYATPLTQILHDNGYYTIHCGKGHFGAIGTAGADLKNFGFDINIAGSAIGGPGSYLSEHEYSSVWRGDYFGWQPIGLEKYYGKGKPETNLTEALTLEAINALNKRDKTKPFYLYMSHYAIHVPIEKDMRFYKKYRDKGMVEQEAAYASMIEGMDKSLGDLMGWLDKNGLAENTIILFMSDNGGWCQSTGARLRGGTPHELNRPLNSGKGSAYEGGIREPMIIKWNGVVKPKTVTDEKVIIEDFFPTILQMAGIEKYKTLQHVDGKTFIPILKGEENPYSDRELFWHFPNKGGNGPGIGTFSSIRKGDFKLIYYWNTSTFELFNINNDIGENRDLLTFEPQKYLTKVEELAKALTTYLKDVKAQRPTYRSNGELVPYPDEVKIETNEVIPEVSDSSKTVWYYIKNNGSNNRNLKALKIGKDGTTTGVDVWSGFPLTKYKIVKDSSKDSHGVVDENGNYLQYRDNPTDFESKKFTGWNIKVANAGSNMACRFGVDNNYFQLRVDCKLRTYNIAETANLWNLISIDKGSKFTTSTAEKPIWYVIKNISEDTRKDYTLNATTLNQPLESIHNGKQKWRVERVENRENTYYVINENGLLLSSSYLGSHFVTKNKKDSSCEWEIRPALTNTKLGWIFTQNFNSPKKTILHQLNYAPYNLINYTAYDQASVWSFNISEDTAVNNNLISQKYGVKVINNSIFVNNGKDFTLYSIDGKELNNSDSLSKGVYLVKVGKFTQKVILR